MITYEIGLEDRLRSYFTEEDITAIFDDILDITEYEEEVGSILYSSLEVNGTCGNHRCQINQQSPGLISLRVTETGSWHAEPPPIIESYIQAHIEVFEFEEGTHDIL